MCMTKNELINDVAVGLTMTLSQDQIDLVKDIVSRALYAAQK